MRNLEYLHSSPEKLNLHPAYDTSLSPGKESPSHLNQAKVTKPVYGSQGGLTQNMSMSSSYQVLPNKGLIQDVLDVKVNPGFETIHDVTIQPKTTQDKTRAINGTDRKAIFDATGYRNFKTKVITSSYTGNNL